MEQIANSERAKSILAIMMEGAVAAMLAIGIGRRATIGAMDTVVPKPIVQVGRSKEVLQTHREMRLRGSWPTRMGVQYAKM